MGKNYLIIGGGRVGADALVRHLTDENYAALAVSRHALSTIRLKPILRVDEADIFEKSSSQCPRGAAFHLRLMLHISCCRMTVGG